jgi:hypothetical protein
MRRYRALKSPASRRGTGLAKSVRQSNRDQSGGVGDGKQGRSVAVWAVRQQVLGGPRCAAPGYRWTQRHVQQLLPRENGPPSCDTLRPPWERSSARRPGDEKIGGVAKRQRRSILDQNSAPWERLSEQGF